MKQKLFPYYLSIALALVLILAGAFQLRSSNLSLAEFSHPALAFFGLYMGDDDEEEEEDDDGGDEGDGEEDNGDDEDNGDSGDDEDDSEDSDDSDDGDSDTDDNDGDDDEGNVDGGDNQYHYCSRCSSTTNAGNTTYHCGSEKFANPCSDNCQSDADCGGSDEPPGDDDDDEEDNTGDGDGQHRECTAVMYGYTSYCRFMSGEGADQCDSDLACRAINPPDKNHTECVGDACVLVDGGGINQCTYYTDCANDSKVNNFVGFVVNNTQQIYTTITTAIQGAWMGFMGFLF